MVNKGLRPKDIMLIDGVVTIRRTMLIPADEKSAQTLLELEGVSSVYPLDVILGIDKNPFKATYKAIAQIAKEGIRNPSYRRAADILNTYHYYEISPSQVKRIVDYVGALIYADDCRRAEESKSYYNFNIDLRKCKKDVLYLEFDGSYYLENVLDESGCEWKECKIAIAFKKSDMQEWGNNTTEIKKRDFVGYIGPSDDFKAHLLALAVRNNAFSVREMVVITDGAKWILPVIRELFPHATPILDMFHAKENAGKFAFAVKRKNQRKKFADQLCDLIDAGDTEELLRVLEPHKDFKQPGVVNFYDYVNRLQDCMHYDVYKQKGYLVGSGHTESSHRYVMQDRMKRPGQHWNRENGQGILSAKCRYESDNWDNVEELIYNDFEVFRNGNYEPASSDK